MREKNGHTDGRTIDLKTRTNFYEAIFSSKFFVSLNACTFMCKILLFEVFNFRDMWDHFRAERREEKKCDGGMARRSVQNWAIAKFATLSFDECMNWMK